VQESNFSSLKSNFQLLIKCTLKNDFVNFIYAELVKTLAHLGSEMNV